MSKIIRTDAGKVLSKAVEYHNFVYPRRHDGGRHRRRTWPVRPRRSWPRSMRRSRPTAPTRPALLQAQVWLKDIRDRDAMNAVWVAWLPEGGAPVRACVEASMADPRLLVEIMVTACK